MKEQTTNRPRELPDKVPRESPEQVPRYYQNQRKIDLIVVHCTATKPSLNYTKEMLWNDHVKYRGWSDIGYHIYVRRNGDIEMCRPLETPGAHAKGYNAHSIGVAWEGGLNQLGDTEDNRTAEQVVSLWHVIEELLIAYPEARLVGHHDLNPHKACPCMDPVLEYKWLTHPRPCPSAKASSSRREPCSPYGCEDPSREGSRMWGEEMALLTKRVLSQQTTPLPSTGGVGGGFPFHDVMER